MTTRKRILLSTITLALLATLAVIRVSIRFGNKEEEEISTVAAIQRFHTRLSTRRFDEIYDDADEVFQKSQSRANAMKVMQDTADHFGKFQQVDFSKINIIIGAQIQIRAVYNSRFERDNATELFTFVDRGGIVKLMHFEISAGEVRP